MNMIKGYDPAVGLYFVVDPEFPEIAGYLTECCQASGKGSVNSPTGVCCRKCYNPVDPIFGTGPRDPELIATAK